MSRKPSKAPSLPPSSVDSSIQYTYLSHNNFGPLYSSKMLPKIADFGSAQPGDQLQIHPIQPDYYRAPEVLLGIGWSYSADIWNLGVLVRLLHDHTLPNHPTFKMGSKHYYHMQLTLDSFGIFSKTKTCLHQECILIVHIALLPTLRR